MAELHSELAELRIERRPERSGGRRAIGWVVALLLLGGAGVAAFKWFTRERPIEVEVATATERAAGTQAAVLNASGYVTARRRATVSSKITGKVMLVDVEEGNEVHEGQVLARLDDSSPKAALALSQAMLEAAKRALRENEVRRDQSQLTLKRDVQLLKDGIVTQSDVDAAQADVDSYEARIAAANEQTRVAERSVDLAQTDIDNTVIRAPFTGIAISKDAQAGEMVSPVSAGGGFTRTGICTIVDMRSLEIEVDVNESYINRVKPGQGVSAVLNAYPDWPIPAHVIIVVPTADRQKATVLVRIAFNHLDPRILPDMGVKVTFLREEDAHAAAATVAAKQPIVLVPKDAVHTDHDQTFVFVVHGGAAERRAVRIGGNDGDRIEVVAGLQSGDRVVLSAPADLKDGSKIVVK
jgi:RND family efflux transporter MFP subunit